MWFWNSLVAQEVAAVVSALVLAIGAVIEYWSKIKLLALLGLKWILRRSTAFDRCTFRKLLIHSIGPILVVLGIAGEFVFEGRTFVLEYRQEQQSENTVASLKARASANDLEAAQLRKDGEQLRKDAEHEHMARAEIENSLSPRRLNPIQKEEIRTTLKRFSPEFALMLYPIGDREAEVFANDIWDALDKALWTATEPGGLMSGREVGKILPHGSKLETSVDGIELMPTTDEASIRAANAFASVFDGLGFDCHIDKPDTNPKSGHRVQVFVATRPIGPQGEAKLWFTKNKQTADSQTSRK